MIAMIFNRIEGFYLLVWRDLVDGLVIIFLFLLFLFLNYLSLSHVLEHDFVLTVRLCSIQILQAVISTQCFIKALICIDDICDILSAFLLYRR